MSDRDETSSVRPCELPRDALLRRYVGRGYTDCWTVDVDRPVAHAEFVEAFDGYVARYGWRTGEIDIIAPSWVEKPELALDQVRLMFRVETDPAEDQRREIASSYRSGAFSAQKSDLWRR